MTEWVVTLNSVIPTLIPVILKLNSVILSLNLVILTKVGICFCVRFPVVSGNDGKCSHPGTTSIVKASQPERPQRHPHESGDLLCIRFPVVSGNDGEGSQPRRTSVRFVTRRSVVCCGCHPDVFASHLTPPRWRCFQRR